MKITNHISFFYIESRLNYINQIINETNSYKYTTDIFIHTNSDNLKIDSLIEYNNGTLNIIVHDLTNINPFYLTWLCRKLLYEQRELYDIFMYIEDDILVPMDALQYWLDYNQKIIANNYNLGFLRIETKDNQEYITDLHGEKFDKILNIDNDKYCINDKNPYCAFWIYNKNEFNKFVNSKYYNINNILNYGIRESSAIGLHGVSTEWYKYSIIPLINNKLIESCKIYHMPNNYVNDNTLFATVNFKDAIELSIL